MSPEEIQKIIDDLRLKQQYNNRISKNETSMLRSSLCDYSDAYILVRATITVPNTPATELNNRKNIIIKNCAHFTNWLREINNTQIDNAKDNNYNAYNINAK